MIIIGHKDVKFSPFYFIKNIDDIDITESNSTIIFEYASNKKELIEHCQTNSVPFANICDEPIDVLFASANGASFIICDKSTVVQAQKFADEYMFDAKILLYASSDEDILFCAQHSIDGILFEEGIQYLDSY